MGGELALSRWNLATQHSKPGSGNLAAPCASNSCGIFLQVITGWSTDLMSPPSPSYTGQPQSLIYKASLFPACSPLFLVLLLIECQSSKGSKRGSTWGCPCLVPRPLSVVAFCWERETCVHGKTGRCTKQRRYPASWHLFCTKRHLAFHCCPQPFCAALKCHKSSGCAGESGLRNYS